MDSSNLPHPPLKSSSFSSPRDEKPREINRKFSLGSIKLNPVPRKKERLANRNTIQEEEEEEEGEEEKPAMQKLSSNVGEAKANLPTVAGVIDKFLDTLTSVQNHNGPPEIPETTIDKFVSLVEKEIESFESGEGKWSAVDGGRALLLGAIERVSKITSAVAGFRSNKEVYKQAINRSGEVLHHGMCFLEDEFYTLLQEGQVKSDPGGCSAKTKRQSSFNRLHEGEHDAAESSTDSEGPPPYSPETVEKLHAIAETMISTGHAVECTQLFAVARRNAFEAALPGLGFEKVSMEDITKMTWETLEVEIMAWIKTFKHTAAVALSAEHDLCEAVFAGHDEVVDPLFRDLARCVLSQLLTFPEAISMTKRSTEKLFKVLDIYEALRFAAPRIDALLPDRAEPEEISVTVGPKADIAAVQCRLGEAAVAIFCELENSIKADINKTPVPGGAVHPLTRYAMNYLKHAGEYKQTMEQVFREHKNPEGSSSSDESNPFAEQLLESMNLLHSNLEAKSRLYKDQALCNIFLMNNGRYIAKSVKASAEIHQLLGETWYRRRSSDLRQYHKNYQRETWSRVLTILRDEGLQGKTGSVSKPLLKERFKSFNAMIEEIHKTQSTWVVNDEQLQSELRVSVSAVVVPAYRSFLGRFAQYLSPGRQTEKYIKFGAEDLENLIDGLFDGNPSVTASKRR